MIKVDIVKTDSKDFENVLRELPIDDLIKILCGVKKELEKDYESFEFEFVPAVPFERIRRITGYLAGTTDRWNNAKQNELNDRVKHK